MDSDGTFTEDDQGNWHQVGTPTERLEYLRGEIRGERISYGELAELADLAEHIDPGDVELLQWAGVPEFDTEADTEPQEAVGAYSVGDVDVWTCLDGICYEATREHIVVAVTNLPTGSQALTLECLTCGQDREIALDSDGCVF